MIFVKHVILGIMATKELLEFLFHFRCSIKQRDHSDYYFSNDLFQFIHQITSYSFLYISIFFYKHYLLDPDMLCQSIIHLLTLLTLCLPLCHFLSNVALGHVLAHQLMMCHSQPSVALSCVLAHQPMMITNLIVLHLYFHLFHLCPLHLCLLLYLFLFY